MGLNRIYSMLEACTTDRPNFPPTLLYNEGWLLRLVMDWFSCNPTLEHPLSFSKDARWFSEALLPSPFLARYRGDLLAESRTHVDGVIGHFTIGDLGKADFSLLPNATQFVALEAKMFSGLSSSVKNVPYFDQVTRNLACIAEVLRRTSRTPSAMSILRFYVLAPDEQIQRGIFVSKTNRESILHKIERRIQDYSGSKDQWYQEWFLPTFQQIDIRVISWEEIISAICQFDGPSGDHLQKFYERCMKFNRKSKINS